MPHPVLSCRELRKRYGSREAVAGISFEVAEGECYGLLGPNGAGKTTTISIACGLLERDGGEVLLEGSPFDHTSVRQRGAIGYVPQEVAVYGDLSGAENMRFFGRLYGLSGARLTGRVKEVLATVGLADRSGEAVDRYSGGMKRRLNIAAGLLHEPRLLVLDEPTVGVDPQSRNSILETVEALQGQGLAVLYTTHYMEEAERLCDRIGIIDGGRLIAEGTRRELVEGVAATSRVHVAASGDLTLLARMCREIPGVEAAEVVEGAVELVASDCRRLFRQLVDASDAAGAGLDGIEVDEPDLETVFLSLTGRALRD